MAKNGCSCCAGWRPNRVSLVLDEQNWATKLFTSHSSHARRARPDSVARKLALWLTPDWRIRANCRVVKASFLAETHSSFLGFQPRLRVASLNLFLLLYAFLFYIEFISLSLQSAFYALVIDSIFYLILNIFTIFDFIKLFRLFWKNGTNQIIFST